MGAHMKARVLLAEDVTGKGHTTRVGADEDLVMLLVPLQQQEQPVVHAGR